MRHAAWRTILLAGGLLVVQNLSATSKPAHGALIPNASGSPLTVHGIPLPANAEPFLAANLTVQNLQALAPNAGPLAKTGWVRAVVYNVQRTVRPDEAAAFYRDTMRAVVLSRRRAPVRGQPLADDGTRVLRFGDQQRTLAIRSADVSGPTRITVALFQGSSTPNGVLDAIDALRDGRSGTPIKEAPALLNPRPWEFDSKWEGTRLETLKQHLLQSANPEPVIDVWRSLLSQARTLHQQGYQVTRRVPATEVLAACAQEAQREQWRLLMVEAVTPDTMTAFYIQPRNRGVVWWRSGRAAKNISPLGGAAPLLSAATEIKRLEVTGQIDLQALFRPSQARPAPRRPPYFAPRPRRTVPTPPAEPLSSERRK